MDLVNLHYLRLLVKHNALELLLLPLPDFRNIREFGAKHFLHTINQLIQLIQKIILVYSSEQVAAKGPQLKQG